MSVEKVRAYLTPYGVAQRIRELEVSSATVELAAAALGVAPARIAKTLSFKVGERPILVVAAGCANMVDKSFVKPGAVVIDVGINVDENGKLCGDVDFKDIQETASMATPVPGGVGSVTTSVLAKRLVHAAQLQNKEA